MDNGRRVPSRPRPSGASLGVTRGRREVGPGVATPSKPVGRSRRQIHGAVDREASGRRGGDPKPDGLILDCREKPLARAQAHGRGVTVPQTDTGGQVEHTEVDGRTSVKELGKFAP